MLFADNPGITQTYWAMGVMAAGLLVCAFAGLTEMKSRTLKQEFPSIWKADRWHYATVIISLLGILTLGGGFYILVAR